jgi:hypothetical protein
LENTAKIPAAAASTNGDVLIVGPDNRLEAAQVEILRKQADSLIVRADGLAGRNLVLSRAPQLGAGIRVEPRAPGGPAILDQKMVKLDPARREKILASLSANTRMPADVRDRLIKQFQQDEVPEDVVARVEARMATAAATPTDDTETVEISSDQRQAMITFVQSNDAIPKDRKTQILESLNQPRVPKSMVDRITKRMGG